jgi:hypothetical protein
MTELKIDRNFMSYIIDAQSGALRDGQHIIYKYGWAIAAGSKESMEALCKFYDSINEKEDIFYVQADLKLANSKSIDEWINTGN